MDELQINVKQICSEALNDLGPGEDIDEALLRASKSLYGEKGMEAFKAVNNLLEADTLSIGRGTKLEKVKKIAEDKRIYLFDLATSKRVIIKKSIEKQCGMPKESVTTTGEIPKEILEKFPELRSKLENLEPNAKKSTKTFSMKKYLIIILFLTILFTLLLLFIIMQITR